ncbi:hypothetical protein PBCV1_A108aR [Paramecium bursaria Chlorella virus 1]|uniref:Uncharacterized protein n=1 Tax=Paramecium bursaria Chlorella virus 1 TaxID=10506 RepID=F8TTX9_PBCV1|nr:hypothetical protein PBCV1_A108aR [Paramecium bursaria Chlorella virus 1]AEI70040.1 hypothetical protein [Paramecium bursaria Chlorella virus 1]
MTNIGARFVILILRCFVKNHFQDYSTRCAHIKTSHRIVYCCWNFAIAPASLKFGSFEEHVER